MDSITPPKSSWREMQIKLFRHRKDWSWQFSRSCVLNNYRKMLYRHLWHNCKTMSMHSGYFWYMGD
jgi:hypothetical protein